MPTNLRSILLMTCSRRIAAVTIPELEGERFFVRSLTEKERSRFEAATLTAKTDGEYRSRLEDAKRRLLALVLCDEEGTPILQPTDVAALEDVDSAVTSRLYNAACRHLGMEQADMEELAKNSGATDAAGSP